MVYIKRDAKYYILIRVPETIQLKQLHVQVLKLFRKENCEYITFQVTESSKDSLSVSGRNPITVPMQWIQRIESLHSILNTKTIDDVIYTVNEFL